MLYTTTRNRRQSESDCLLFNILTKTSLTFLKMHDIISKLFFKQSIYKFCKIVSILQINNFMLYKTKLKGGKRMYDIDDFIFEDDESSHVSER